MGKYTDRLDEYVNIHAVSIVSANPINGGSNLQHPSTDTVNTDTVVHAVSIVSDVSNTKPHAVSIDGVSSTPLRLNKYTDGIKAADAFKYVACVNCTNLKKVIAVHGYINQRSLNFLYAFAINTSRYRLQS